jgi:O-antigen ligase
MACRCTTRFSQGTEFLVCGFGALGYAASARQKGAEHWQNAIFAIGALFLINFAFATASRIALVIAPLLLLLLGWRLFRWKGILVAILLAAMAGNAMWVASNRLRDRVVRTVVEMQEYTTANRATSIGEHIAVLKESLEIIGSAPIIGHGTGSIADEFRRICGGGKAICRSRCRLEHFIRGKTVVVTGGGASGSNLTLGALD